MCHFAIYKLQINCSFLRFYVDKKSKNLAICSLYLLLFSLYYWFIVLVLVYFCTSCKISAIVMD